MHPSAFTIAAAVAFAIAASACTAETAPSGWVRSPEGETILRPFRNAPYPHASHAGGFTINGKTFTAEQSYSDSTVGIFIPAGFHPSGPVDLVFHFHGHSNHVAKALDEYQLRQEFAKSGLNAILVVPQGPKDATDSGCGHLQLDRGAFAALTQEALDFLKAEGKIPEARVGHIALTAHSGGYLVTSSILTHGGLTDHITDVLLFDASYGALEGFANWQCAGKGRRLVSLFTEHLATANVELMSLLDKHGARFHVLMDKELPARPLKERAAWFIHTPDLAHNDVMHARGYYSLFLSASALSQR